MAEEQVLIERDDVPVMLKRVADEPDAITRGMADLERAVGLRRRKYYGRLRRGRRRVPSVRGTQGR